MISIPDNTDIKQSKQSSQQTANKIFQIGLLKIQKNYQGQVNRLYQKSQKKTLKKIFNFQKLNVVQEQNVVQMKNQSFISFQDYYRQQKQFHNYLTLQAFFSCIKMSSQYNIKNLIIRNTNIKKSFQLWPNNQKESHNKNSDELNSDKLNSQQDQFRHFSDVLLLLSNTAFSNLEYLSLIEMSVNNIEAITYLYCPIIRQFDCKQNLITNLKCLDKTNFKLIQAFCCSQDIYCNVPTYRMKLNKEAYDFHFFFKFNSQPNNWNIFAKYQHKKMKFGTMNYDDDLHKDQRFSYPFKKYISREGTNRRTTIVFRKI